MTNGLNNLQRPHARLERPDDVIVCRAGDAAAGRNKSFPLCVCAGHKPDSSPSGSVLLPSSRRCWSTRSSLKLTDKNLISTHLQSFRGQMSDPAETPGVSQRKWRSELWCIVSDHRKPHISSLLHCEEETLYRLLTTETSTLCELNFYYQTDRNVCLHWACAVSHVTALPPTS